MKSLKELNAFNTWFINQCDLSKATVAKVTEFDEFDFVYRACIGWSRAFIAAQDILREMEVRKIVPDNLKRRVHNITTIDELPKRYMKGGNLCG